ncbi:hypothetical protein [Mesorhizobium sp.]|uniref:hypothetical protein n=1 Tax=Mesorhizobium sp. TaxID=1871066 RepID=UPI00121377AA|nr:hypothetical protein [Mesorhizobium sp.]TIQ49712.1 MAG: hypothetical protein E5X47_11160 [Mesorhizobium sp.]TIQ54858.1 MAG: hypothetical protein E5X46_25630 [Mesorhizobium sp.]
MFNEAAAISEGAIVQITGAVIGKSMRPDGRTSYRVQFEREGERFEESFFAEDLIDLGFDD